MFAENQQSAHVNPLALLIFSEHRSDRLGVIPPEDDTTPTNIFCVPQIHNDRWPNSQVGTPVQLRMLIELFDIKKIYSTAEIWNMHSSRAGIRTRSIGAKITGANQYTSKSVDPWDEK